MSLPKFPKGSHISREKALNMILSSIASEELALSHIINAEGEKLQFVLANLNHCNDKFFSNVLKVNNSIENVLDSVFNNQIVLKAKMEKVLKALPPQLTPKPPSPPCPSECAPCLPDCVPCFPECAPCLCNYLPCAPNSTPCSADYSPCSPTNPDYISYCSLCLAPYSSDFKPCLSDIPNQTSDQLANSSNKPFSHPPTNSVNYPIYSPTSSTNSTHYSPTSSINSTHYSPTSSTNSAFYSPICLSCTSPDFQSTPTGASFPLDSNCKQPCPPYISKIIATFKYSCAYILKRSDKFRWHCNCFKTCNSKYSPVVINSNKCYLIIFSGNFCAATNNPQNKNKQYITTNNENYDICLSMQIKSAGINKEIFNFYKPNLLTPNKFIYVNFSTIIKLCDIVGPAEISLVMLNPYKAAVSNSSLTIMEV